MSTENLRKKLILLVLLMMALIGTAFGWIGYRRIRETSLPITRHAQSFTLKLQSAVRKKGGPAVITVTMESNTPGMELGDMQVNGRECASTIETAFPDLDCRHSRANAGNLDAMLARHISTITSTYDGFVPFNAVTVTQPVFIRRRVSFRFIGVGTSGLPITRRAGNAAVTLSSIFIDKPTSSTWPLQDDGWEFDEQVLGVVVTADLPEGFVRDHGCTLTDDNGTVHRSVAEGSASYTAYAKTSSGKSSAKYFYLFKNVKRIPRTVSFEICGTLPPEKTVLVRFPTVFVKSTEE